MSIKVMSEVWEYDLPSKEKFVLLCLADFADDYGGSVYPSIATVSRKCSIPERTVQRIMRSLKDRGVLRVLRPSTRARTVEYRIILNGLDKSVDPDYSTCPAALRREVIEVFGYQCTYCQKIGDKEKGPDGHSWHVERINPGSRGGRYEPYNVTLSCRACNLSKGAKLAPPNTESLGAKLDKEGCQIEQTRVPRAAHNTSVKPSEEPPVVAPLPTGLNLAAWNRWLEFRKKMKFKAYKTNDMANKLARYPPDVQAQTVQHSIEQNYQGLFPDKFANGGSNAKPSKKYSIWDDLPGPTDRSVVSVQDGGDLLSQVDQSD